MPSHYYLQLKCLSYSNYLCRWALSLNNQLVFYCLFIYCLHEMEGVTYQRVLFKISNLEFALFELHIENKYNTLVLIS